MVTSKQASQHIHVCAQYSYASVGLAQARPNKHPSYWSLLHPSLSQLLSHMCMCTHTPIHMHIQHAASFPGRSCLQFLIACTMQKRRGKVWEKESRM